MSQSTVNAVFLMCKNQAAAMSHSAFPWHGQLYGPASADLLRARINRAFLVYARTADLFFDSFMCAALLFASDTSHKTLKWQIAELHENGH